jgi:hypothetical protein
MSFIFGGSKSAPAPKPIPTVQHEEVKAAGDAARRRSRSASGRASTMLTSGGLGDLKTSVVKLLGA